MKNKLLFPAAAVLLLTNLFAFTVSTFKDKNAKAEEEVKELILKSYINGAFNALDPEAMRAGFHPDFAIFSADGENISKYPIAAWADGVEKKKNDPNFDPAKNKWEHNFASVDVTGGSAAVKVELFHEGKHVFTDYLSLLKFDSGWKIVAKVYHKH
ncbi:MAG: nuclear transport factor 2 family protein [Lewinellaceae bacterium]|nr:nuclear transport factor 2 family protein [Lewinellaceae bacterium]